MFAVTLGAPLWAAQPLQTAGAPGQAAPAAIGSGALQQVVVTAERVAQNIQRVPVSMNVLTGQSLAQPAFGLLSAQMTLEPYSSRWELRLWGNNLTNRVYYTNEVDLQSLGYDYRHIGEPRMYGADVTYRF